MALVRQRARAVRNWLERTGPGQSAALIESDAQAYWRNAAHPGWHSNSHWREGKETLWDGIGTSTLALAEQLVGVTGGPLPRRRTVEWGAGGGANAVRFAARCDEFIAVDIAQASLEECERQVALVTPTPNRRSP